MNGVEREVKRQGKEALWNKLHKIAEKTPFPLRRYLFGRVHRQFGGKLDFIVSGGAALDPDLGRKWEALGVKIVQGYGATEASPVISNHSIKERRMDSTGRPLPNVEVKINPDGEILARGDSITPGLLEQPRGHRGSLRRRLVQDGRPGLPGRQRFSAHPGPQEGHDSPPQRPERLSRGTWRPR